MTLALKVTQFENDADIVHQIVHGPASGAGSTVDTDGGPVRTMAKMVDDAQGVFDDHVADTTNPHGVTKAQVGLGAADNTADADKPVSTAQQAALDLKANLASPAFTGVPTTPTAAAGTNTTQVASTAFVRAELNALVAAAPGTLDTLDELAAALGDDPNFATTVTTSLASKEVATNKNASGGYAGLTLFKINLKNAAGTVTSWLASAATAARTWTFPDKDGTVAMTSDIVAVEAAIHAAASKATLVDADELGLADSAAAWALKKLSWSDLKTNIAAWWASASATLSRKTLKSPKETVTVSATAATGAIQFDALTQADVYYTTAATANFTLNFRGDATPTTLDSLLAVGEEITLVFRNTNGATARALTAITIDGAAVTPKWANGAQPAASASAVDVYSFTITKTAAATFTVFASMAKYA